MDASHQEMGHVSLQGAAPGGIAKDNVHGGGSPEAAIASAQHAAEQAAQSAAQNAMMGAAQNAAQQATNAISERLRSASTEVSLYVQANPYSITLLSFFGGVVLIVISLLGLISILSLVGGPLTYLLQIYQIYFGLIIVCIDGPLSTKFPSLAPLVLQHASFLATNNSRAAFYLFIACLEGSQSDIHKFVGWYFAAIGVMYVIVHVLGGSQSQRSAANLGQPLR